jgi:hypothetical protein
MSLTVRQLTPAQRRAYDLRTRPPGWRPPEPAATALKPTPPPPTTYVPVGHAPAWQRLHMFLLKIAADELPLPSMPEIASLCRLDTSALSKAMKHLSDYGYIERQVVQRGRPVSEMRIVIVESGDVLTTVGWVG